MFEQQCFCLSARCGNWEYKPDGDHSLRESGHIAIQINLQDYEVSVTGYVADVGHRQDWEKNWYVLCDQPFI